MTFTGEVVGQQSTGDGVKVTVTNVRRKAANLAEQYGPEVSVIMPPRLARRFGIGRIVVLSVKPK